MEICIAMAYLGSTADGKYLCHALLSVHSPEAPKAKATRQLVRLEKSSLLMGSRLQTIVRAIKLNINYHSHSKSKNVQGQATH